MKTLIKLIISTIAIIVAAYLIQGVVVDSFLTAFVVAVVLGLVNTFVKPLVTILTLPITFLTLGLFTLVISALMVILTDAIVPGFSVTGFIPALLFGLVLSIVNTFIQD